MSSFTKEYRQCAGKNCKKQGIHYLKILFINMNGWFCKSCKNNLIVNNLAKEVFDTLKSKESSKCRIN